MGCLARDRRFDHLYDRQKQPVKDFLLDRFAGEVATELAAWPPPFVEWVSDELRARWSAGLRERPREAVVRLALELARLDLRREFEAAARRLAEAALRPEEEAACHLLVRLVTEKALALREWAEGARLSRDDLVGLVGRIERRLFLVT